MGDRTLHKSIMEKHFSVRRLVVRLQITDASRNCNDEHIAARSRSNCSFHVVTIAKYDTPWRKPRGCLSGLGFGLEAGKRRVVFQCSHKRRGGASRGILPTGAVLKGQLNARASLVAALHSILAVGLSRRQLGQGWESQPFYCAGRQN